MANLTSEEFDRVIEYLRDGDGDDNALFYLQRVVGIGSVNRNRIIIFRAAVYKYLRIRYFDNTKSEEDQTNGPYSITTGTNEYGTPDGTRYRIIDKVAGENGGYIDYATCVIEAVAAITHKNVLCVEVGDNDNNGYIYAEIIENSIDCHLFRNGQEQAYVPRRKFVNTHQGNDTICVRRCGKHFQPFKQAGMTDNGKFGADIDLNTIFPGYDRDRNDFLNPQQSQISQPSSQKNKSKSKQPIHKKEIKPTTETKGKIDQENISFNQPDPDIKFTNMGQTNSANENSSPQKQKRTSTNNPSKLKIVFKNALLNRFYNENLSNLEKLQLRLWDNGFRFR